MGCRSFLSPWKDENGNYKWEGRFNQGVVSLNLPQIGILAKGDEDKFWSLLDERLQLCYDALMCRHRALEGITSDVSPIHRLHAFLRDELHEQGVTMPSWWFSMRYMGSCPVFLMTLRLMTSC